MSQSQLWFVWTRVFNHGRDSFWSKERQQFLKRPKVEMVKWIWDAFFFCDVMPEILRPSRCKICDLPLVSASVLARAFRSDKWDTEEWETISRGLQLTTSNKKHGTRNILFHHGSGVGCRACWQCFFLGVAFPHFLAAFFLEWKKILLSPTMVSLILEVNRFLTLSAISNFLEHQLSMKATQRPVNWCTTGAWCPCRHFYLCIQAHTHTIGLAFHIHSLQKHWKDTEHYALDVCFARQKTFLTKQFWWRVFYT